MMRPSSLVLFLASLLSRPPALGAVRPPSPSPPLSAPPSEPSATQSSATTSPYDAEADGASGLTSGMDTGTVEWPSPSPPPTPPAAPFPPSSPPLAPVLFNVYPYTAAGIAAAVTFLCAALAVVASLCWRRLLIRAMQHVEDVGDRYAPAPSSPVPTLRAARSALRLLGKEPSGHITVAPSPHTTQPLPRPAEPQFEAAAIDWLRKPPPRDLDLGQEAQVAIPPWRVDAQIGTLICASHGNGSSSSPSTMRAVTALDWVPTSAVFVSHVNWPLGMPPFVTHASPPSPLRSRGSGVATGAAIGAGTGTMDASALSLPMREPSQPLKRLAGPLQPPARPAPVLLRPAGTSRRAASGEAHRATPSARPLPKGSSDGHERCAAELHEEMGGLSSSPARQRCVDGLHVSGSGHTLNRNRSSR